MSETKTIAISGIAVAIHRLRALRPDKVDALAQSMTDQGLLQPIVVRPHKGGGYWLVAGLHRIEAAKKLKWIWRDRWWVRVGSKKLNGFTRTWCAAI